jgi:gliding motility-associated-like protein
VSFGPFASGCAPLTVQFNNTTTATLGSSCVWNFGDGSPPETNNCLPSHTYNKPGTYSVSLTVTTPEGCSGTLTIPIYPFPMASFTADPWETTIMEPAIQFTNTSSGDSVRLWTFGDGASDTQNNPVHIYEDTGRYVVCLDVINSFGCRDSVCQTVIIRPVWSFYIPNAFTPNGDGHNETFNGKGENIYDYRILIFDRWGNEIFESSSLYKGWDGRANGGVDIAQQDVYVYLVSFKDIFDKKHKLTGIVTLVR